MLVHTVYFLHDFEGHRNANLERSFQSHHVVLKDVRSLLNMALLLYPIRWKLTVPCHPW